MTDSTPTPTPTPAGATGPDGGDGGDPAGSGPAGSGPAGSDARPDEGRPEAAADPAAEAAPESATEPATEPATESSTEPAPESSTEPATEPAAESAPESSTEPGTEPAAETSDDAAPAAGQQAEEEAEEGAEEGAEEAPDATPEPDTEPAGVEEPPPLESETVESETVESETAETEADKSAETEEAESAETEADKSAETEADGVDSVEVEAGDAEAGDAEPGEVEPADVEPADVEPVHHPRHRADTAHTPRVTELIATAEPQTGTAQPGRRHESRRHRLTRAITPRSTRGQLLAAVLCAVLGFAMVAQARQTNADGLASLRESELVEILSGLNEQSTRLESEIRDLQDIHDELSSGSSSGEAAQKAAQERLDVLGILTGTVPTSGPGIQLLISDPDRAVSADQLLNAVQELRGAGAEAIQIGDVRVVAQTALVEGREGVVVDGTTLMPPYKILAVGDPQALSTALNIPGGVMEVLRNDGATGTIRRIDDLRIDALRALDDAQYARPAPTKE